ncbi:MAG TPA: ArsC family reductase [Ramlibacter sp.]|nr:ArsC family reductase [Ramlibacter sp.]
MQILVHGIPNCDTVKKARAWLADQGLAYQFHDFKKDGVPIAKLDGWIAGLGWEALVNRKGTTWRKLDGAVQAGIQDSASARRLMVDQPSVIKRPVVEWDGQATVGFDPQAWALRARA